MLAGLFFQNCFRDQEPAGRMYPIWRAAQKRGSCLLTLFARELPVAGEVFWRNEQAGSNDGIHGVAYRSIEEKRHA